MKNLVYGLVLGSTVSIIGAYLTGYSAAIASPKSFFDIFPGLLGLLVWDTFVVQLLGFGIVAALCSFYVARRFDVSWPLVAVLAFFVVQLMLWVLFRLDGQNITLLMVPHWLVLLVSLFAGGYFGASRKGVKYEL